MTVKRKPYLSLLCLFLVVSLSVAGLVLSLYAQQSTTEYQLKAAFLYNFGKFVEWPAEAFAHSGNTMNLCVLGEDPFGTALDVYQDEIIRNKRLVKKHLKTLQHVKHCHILYICRSEKESLEQIVKSLKGLNILTVGDTKGFARYGVIINFYIEQDKVRFEVNVSAAKRAGLKLSSRLLRLAKIVEE